jgi:rubrerythrin
MGRIKGSKTERNLLKAFAGESQARNRYTYFGGKARKEGFVQISEIFLKTADQEKEHAKRFFSFLEGGMLEITAAFPAGILDAPTADNLQAAAAGEHEEYETLYPSFGKVAEEEGFSDVAALFRNVCVAERQHEKRYLQLLENIKNGSVFEKNDSITWICSNCGFMLEGKAAPQKCPACLHPRDYFMVMCEKF